MKKGMLWGLIMGISVMLSFSSPSFGQDKGPATDKNFKIYCAGPLFNDKEKDLNRGRIASIKNFLKLSSYFNCI